MDNLNGGAGSDPSVSNSEDEGGVDECDYVASDFESAWEEGDGYETNL